MPLKRSLPIRTTRSIQKCNKNIAQKSDLFFGPFYRYATQGAASEARRGPLIVPQLVLEYSHRAATSRDFRGVASGSPSLARFDLAVPNQGGTQPEGTSGISGMSGIGIGPESGMMGVSGSLPDLPDSTQKFAAPWILLAEMPFSRNPRDGADR
jgi:hypothetical protein